MSTANYPYHNMCVVVEGIEDPSDVIPFREDFKQSLPKRTKIERYTGFKYEGTILAISSIYKKWEHYATIYILLREGYYYGVYLDYYIEYGGLKETILEERSLGKRLNAVRKLLAKFGTQIERVATFNNGEAVYKKVD